MYHTQNLPCTYDPKTRRSVSQQPSTTKKQEETAFNQVLADQLSYRSIGPSMEIFPHFGHFEAQLHDLQSKLQHLIVENEGLINVNQQIMDENAMLKQQNLQLHQVQNQGQNTNVQQIASLQQYIAQLQIDLHNQQVCLNNIYHNHEIQIQEMHSNFTKALKEQQQSLKDSYRAKMEKVMVQIQMELDQTTDRENKLIEELHQRQQEWFSDRNRLQELVTRLQAKIQELQPFEVKEMQIAPNQPTNPPNANFRLPSTNERSHNVYEPLIVHQQQQQHSRLQSRAIQQQNEDHSPPNKVLNSIYTTQQSPYAKLINEEIPKNPYVQQKQTVQQSTQQSVPQYSQQQQPQQYVQTQIQTNQSQQPQQQVSLQQSGYTFREKENIDVEREKDKDKEREIDSTRDAYKNSSSQPLGVLSLNTYKRQSKNTFDPSMSQASCSDYYQKYVRKDELSDRSRILEENTRINNQTQEICRQIKNGQYYKH